jgi:DNA invertase Pin-like site-specific DNA recombinase
MRAAIYCRISRDRQEVMVDGEKRFTMLGVERQEEDCREACARLGWSVAEVFVDNDVSATTGKVRPRYEAMLAAIAEGRVDAIVCWHPDRLYRRVADLERLIATCERYHVPISTVNAGAVDLTTPTGRLVAGLLAQVNKYEGEHKAERWVRSFKQRREAGAPTGGGTRMYGWDREGNLIPGEVATIRGAVSRVLEGVPLKVIAMEVNEAGARTTKGNLWRATAIKNLLENPRLAGWTTMYGEVVSDSTWPAILTRDEWHDVQRALSANAGRPRARVAWLLGVARCGVCDSALITGARSPHRGKSVRVYKCPSACVTIAAQRLEETVEKEVFSGVNPPPVDVTIRNYLAAQALESVHVDPVGGAQGRGFDPTRIRIARNGDFDDGLARSTS